MDVKQIAFLISILVLVAGCAAGDNMVVKKGDTVKVEYTGTLKNGTQFDTSKGRDPLEFTAGAGQVIPGFDNAVIGMKLNEEKTFTIPSGEAYGGPRPELVQQVPKKALTDKFDAKIGDELTLQAPNGQRIRAIVKEIGAENVTLDMNHPLAGQDLTFTVKVVGID